MDESRSTLDEAKFTVEPHPDLAEFVRTRDEMLQLKPQLVYPLLFRPCVVRVLLVTDGSLDFGAQDFGLRAFVATLQASPFYVSYAITLAHRRNRSGDAMMESDQTIARRITNFRFNDAGHFAPDMYDEVWLFGIESTPELDPVEVRAVAEFMDGGGGVFATGDHGALGKAMGSRIPRVRSMRIWDHTTPIDEVGMTDHRRNDTNNPGHDPASEFDDQSDDVPQRINPKLYRRSAGLWEAVFPHPVLCGSRGMIDVMPDHPHEGECVAPSDLSRQYTFDGATFVEYPPGAGGSARPLPEIISTSVVPAGNIASTGEFGRKDATQAHCFGGISAYDGHRAAVGRVITDSTWHHFVNVNLVGDLYSPDERKRTGFLYSSRGRAHLSRIRNYYANLAIWLARPALIECMNRRIIWQSIFEGRVVEAVATAYSVPLAKADLRLISAVGSHARDVLGRTTSVCQARSASLWLLERFVPMELMAQLDPWHPDGSLGDGQPWFAWEPLLDSAVGAAVIALRDEFLGIAGEDIDAAEERFDDVALAGVEIGVRRAIDSAREMARVVDRQTRGEREAASS